jgi:hypothetical protein
VARSCRARPRLAPRCSGRRAVSRLGLGQVQRPGPARQRLWRCTRQCSASSAWNASRW